MTQSTHNLFEGNYYLGSYKHLPDDKEARQLTPTYRKLIEDCGKEGLMQFMDSVSIAGNAQCVFVNKQKIEAFFNQLSR